MLYLTLGQRMSTTGFVTFRQMSSCAAARQVKHFFFLQNQLWREGNCMTTLWRILRTVLVFVGVTEGSLYFRPECHGRDTVEGGVYPSGRKCKHRSVFTLAPERSLCFRPGWHFLFGTHGEVYRIKSGLSTVGVGPGFVFSCLTGRVGSGRIGSGQEVFGLSRAGSGPWSKCS